jgi:tetratricopeptide (TPR) repeat protein
MFYHLISLLIVWIPNSSEQHFLGTHFYVNQDNILIDNTFKTVSTLARPYDLVAFIRQSERLARVDHLQTYIDAVVESSSPSEQSPINSKKQDNDEHTDQCNDFLRDGESLIFQILKTNLYDTFHIPFELKNLSNNYTIDEKSKTKIFTCDHFCQINTSLLTFDHLPSISTRYDEQEIIRIDDDDINPSTINYHQQALWSMHELSHNRTSWLAYVYLSRYFHFNSLYYDAIDCLRCALSSRSNHDDIIFIDLANIVFRYGYIRDAILFIEKALDYHLRFKTNQMKSLFIRSILHYYLGNLCTIDNRFLLAIQFYNRTKILLERIRKTNDEQQLEL